MNGRMAPVAKQWLLGTATGLMLASPLIAAENPSATEIPARPAAEASRESPPDEAARQSAVLEHLQKLYARDGLAMPAMRLSEIPRAPEAVHQARTPSLGAVAGSPVAATPRQPAAPSPALVEMLTGIQQTRMSQTADPSGVEPADDQQTAPAIEPVEAPQPLQEPQHLPVADQPAETTGPYTGLTLDQPAATLPAAPQPPSAAPADPRMQQIAARAGQTGLKGFCPVALRDARQLQDARPEWLSTFEGVTYHLSSAEARQAFDAHPERYAPAAQGCDVVLLSRDGETMPGALDHAVWFRDRLYLFHSVQTKAAFAAAPRQYVRGE